MDVSHVNNQIKFYCRCVNRNQNSSDAIIYYFDLVIEDFMKVRSCVKLIMKYYLNFPRNFVILFSLKNKLTKLTELGFQINDHSYVKMKNCYCLLQQVQEFTKLVAVLKLQAMVITDQNFDFLINCLHLKNYFNLDLGFTVMTQN